MKISKNERIDDLEFKGLKIIQNTEEFCFGMDSILLVNFAKEIKKDSKVIDLGTGTGIIPILLSKKIEAKSIIGIEIQQNMAEMANRSVFLNNLQDNVKIINEDIKNLEKIFEKGTLDSVITNPPYIKSNSGLRNESEGKLISRHEVKCVLEDVIKITSYLLRNNGSFYMVHRPERFVDIAVLMRKYKIEPKKIRFVYPYKTKEANLILIKGVKNGKAFLKMDKPLYVYEENGQYSQEILEIYDKKGEILWKEFYI